LGIVKTDGNEHRRPRLGSDIESEVQPGLVELIKSSRELSHNLEMISPPGSIERSGNSQVRGEAEDPARTIYR
jgi:hypothetical protein